MTDNRNTILAVILSGLVLIAWQYFYNMPQMERQRAQSQTQAELAKPPQQTTPGATPQPGRRGSKSAGTRGEAIWLRTPVLHGRTILCFWPALVVELVDTLS